MPDTGSLYFLAVWAGIVDEKIVLCCVRKLQDDRHRPPHSGRNPPARFREAAIAPLALLKIEQRLVKL